MFKTIKSKIAPIVVLSLFVGSLTPAFSQEFNPLLAQNSGYGETKTYRSDYNSSYSQGQSDAKMMSSSGGWFAGGVGSGLLLGLIGATIVTVAADGDRPYQVPQNTDQQAYMLGYYEQSKSSNKWSAFGGGCVGTAIIVALIVGASK